MNIAQTNRIGSQKGMALKVRQAPNPEETIAVSIWKSGNYNSILYDPWCSNMNAQVVHGHYHTSWGRNIHRAIVDGMFKNPAIFDWKGKTVYIIGRGRSLKRNVEALNSVERKNPAIFLNTSYNDIELQPVDFVMIADNRILGVDEYRGAVNSPLLSFPGIDRDIVGDNWRGLYGFVPWTSSPLNNWMREDFPHLPAILDILTVSVMATHLALVNQAENIVFMGDNTFKGKHRDKIKTKDVNGNPCKTIKGYYEMATALCQLAGFARFHCATKFFNATGRGVLGVNYFEKETRFPWVKQLSAQEAVERFDRQT